MVNMLKIVMVVMIGVAKAALMMVVAAAILLAAHLALLADRSTNPMFDLCLIPPTWVVALSVTCCVVTAALSLFGAGRRALAIAEQ